MAKEKKNKGMSDGFEGRMRDFAPVIKKSGSKAKAETKEDEE